MRLFKKKRGPQRRKTNQRQSNKPFVERISAHDRRKGSFIAEKIDSKTQVKNEKPVYSTKYTDAGKLVALRHNALPGQKIDSNITDHKRRRIRNDLITRESDASAFEANARSQAGLTSNITSRVALKTDRRKTGINVDRRVRKRRIGQERRKK